jgi:hypothetical protein
VAISLFKVIFLLQIWHLGFVICNCAERVAPVLTARKNKWQLDKTNRTYFDNRMGRLTYGKELLNFRKTSNFYKTNHLQLCRVSPPAPTARKDKRQTDETNRMCLKLNLPEVIALRTKRAVAAQRKQ